MYGISLRDTVAIAASQIVSRIQCPISVYRRAIKYVGRSGDHAKHPIVAICYSMPFMCRDDAFAASDTSDDVGVCCAATR
jgi:hypothetical protein